MRSCVTAFALALIVAAGCDPGAEGADAPAAADEPQATVGPPEADAPAAAREDEPARRGPRPAWLGEDGSFEIEGTRYEADPTVMILDRERLEPIGTIDGVELYEPGWADDPRKRIFAEEEPDRWRPFVRVDPLPG